MNTTINRRRQQRSHHRDCVCRECLKTRFVRAEADKKAAERAVHEAVSVMADTIANCWRNASDEEAARQKLRQALNRLEEAGKTVRLADQQWFQKEFEELRRSPLYERPLSQPENGRLVAAA